MNPGMGLFLMESSDGSANINAVNGLVTLALTVSDESGRWSTVQCRFSPQEAEQMAAVISEKAQEARRQGE